jgi:hypothetical protein
MEQLQREVLAALAPLRQAREPSGLPPGMKAPAFTLPDLSGQPLSLRGEPLRASPGRVGGAESVAGLCLPPACREQARR